MSTNVFTHNWTAETSAQEVEMHDSSSARSTIISRLSILASMYSNSHALLLMALCIECDRPFDSQLALQQHLRDSPSHATTYACVDCDRFFNSDNALQQHLQDSPAHRELATHDSVSINTYDGIPATSVNQVFKVAMKLRHNRPSIDEIVKLSGTNLDTAIVMALWSAAERLNSMNETLENAQRRAERDRERSRLAQLAENAFVQQFEFYGHHFTRELDLRERANRMGVPLSATPDMTFATPVSIRGMLCAWIEFKHYFGFPRNPFVAKSEKRQLRKYLIALGPGAVVYDLGFQSGYPNIDGIAVFRAQEVLQSISRACSSYEV